MRGIGVDILAISRLTPLEGKWDNPFFIRVFTEEEYRFCMADPNPLRAFAAAFAVKEAVFKALSLPAEGVRLRDIEVGRSDIGQPTAVLHGDLARRAAENGIRQLHVSLTYEENMVVAFAAAE